MVDIQWRPRWNCRERGVDMELQGDSRIDNGSTGVRGVRMIGIRVLSYRLHVFELFDWMEGQFH